MAVRTREFYSSFLSEKMISKPFSRSFQKRKKLSIFTSPTPFPSNYSSSKTSVLQCVRNKEVVVGKVQPPPIVAAALSTPDYVEVEVEEEVVQDEWYKRYTEDFLEVSTENNSKLMFNVTAFLTIMRKKKIGIVKEFMLDAFSNSSSKKNGGGGVVLQLVSTQIDPRTREPKLSKEAVLEWPKSVNGERATHKVEFMVDSNFGVPGAIIVMSNKFQEELFFENITIEGVVHFTCNSWVQPEKINSSKRIFFTNKAYLPCDTPAGLKKLRERELSELRGDGKGLRILSDRIYDYDMYNDLGNPDKGTDFVRPTLGGKIHPHPRRCRTGRPSSKTDKNTESPIQATKMSIYVPRDEALGEPKSKAFSQGKLKGIFRNVIPSLVSTISNEDDVIKDIPDIYDLYKGRPLKNTKSQDGFLKNLPLPKVISKSQNFVDELLKFDPPKVMSRETFSPRDDEFGRQAIAGINPLNIERLEVFPPLSKLDPSIYGPQESAITEKHLRGSLEGMFIQQALDDNKLFILDYHDIYLPFLNRINAIESRKAHATRTLFFLTSLGTLKPIAIELSLPPTDLDTQPSKQVLTPPVDATTNWLWQLGKAHVCSNDAGVHQLVNHWLRTHACMEPFIIAMNRQLSTTHPIYKLLDPHTRYTLEINALARETLVNAGGVIEFDFTPGMYCMEISCAAYRDWWRFDLEGLPADLIRRGMAIPDSTKAHGLRLLIEDYPYANDGLLIWAAIERLVQTYVNYYYSDENLIQADSELQAWYNESINVGHADVRHASWWPKLSTPSDLASILTILIWLASAQHAAVNFGQYPYGGYIPTRPPLMRRLVPSPDDPSYAEFVSDPHEYFLLSLPSLFQATKFMAVIDIISAHSPDEEYLGERKDLSSWTGDTEIIEAFYKFSMEMKRIEKVIEKRNNDPKLRNRCGAGITPYELLIPSSGPGVTSRGVPNSITV